MVDREQAEAIAGAYLRDLGRKGSPECVLLRQETLDEAFGWVFFYQSREYVATGRSSAMLAGTAPLLVLRETGELRVLGTDLPVENYLVAYRASLDRVEESYAFPLPRAWLRGFAIGAAVTSLLWIVSAVVRSGGRESPPSGALTLLVGLLLLPIGVAAARNLDGMARTWGRRALARLGRRTPFGFRLEDVEQPEDVERMSEVGQEGLGRQMGGILILLSLGWIAFGIGILTGVLHN